MPSHSSRQAQHQRLPPAVNTFTQSDVNAFRLRPLLCSLDAVTQSTSTSASVSRPSRQKTVGDKPKTATARGYLSTVSVQQNGRSVQSTIPAASTTAGMEAMRVPPLPSPCVYAALIPPRPQPTERDNDKKDHTPGEEAGQGQQTNEVTPSRAVTVRATGALNVSNHDALLKLPTPTIESVVTPDLSATEKRHMALWTRSAQTFAVPLATAHVHATSSNEPLHRFWRERQTVRLHQRYLVALNEGLYPTLEQAVRQLLTAEERHWQTEMKLQQEQYIGTRLERSTGSPVPPHKMAALLQAVQLLLHQTSISYIEAQNLKETAAASTLKETTAGGRSLGAEHHSGGLSHPLSPTRDPQAEAAEELSQDQYREVMQTTLDTEHELVEEMKQQLSNLHSVSGGVSIATLPSDLPVPPAVLRLEAAVSVALLSSIIEHAMLSAPGMDLAGRLLEQYILPHMYAGYTGWGAVRPQLGTLSEQVTHLAALPLRLQQQRSLTVAAVQAQDDVNYLQMIVKSCTMRAWLHQVLRERRDLARLDATERVVARRWKRFHLQRAFTAWRRHVQNEHQSLVEAKMEAAYMNFLQESKLAAQRDKHAYGGSTVTMATALLVCAPKSSASSVANMWSRCQRPQLEKVQEQPQPTSEDVTEFSETGILVSDSPTKVDSRVQGAPVPSGTQRWSTIVPIAPTQSRAYYEDNSAKRKGAGHSRVKLSIIRPKMGKRSPRGRNHRRDSEDSDTMERYVVSGDDSEDNANTTSGGADNASLEGSGTNTQFVYLKSPLEESNKGDNGTSDVHSTQHLIYPTNDTHTNVGEAGMCGAAAETGDIMGTSLFHVMLAKLQEMDQVNAYLRSELAVQSKRLRKVEAANIGLRERNHELENSTLQLLREKLEALNTVQDQHVIIQDKNRRLRQLRSRLRAHRHRPWQSTVLRIVGDMCEASTADAEYADEARVNADRYGTEDSSDEDRDSEVDPQSPSHMPRKPSYFAQGATAGQVEPAVMPVKGRSSPRGDVKKKKENHHEPKIENDDERIFGCIAPTVLQSCTQLPDAFVILNDWANSCLDDLESLDDAKDGPFADRFSSFNEEARSGFLISRLLYYLALPRYRSTRPVAEQVSRVSNDMDMSDHLGAQLSGFHYRRQLLEQQSVQLNPPFPVFADCFGDIMDMQPTERMCQLLAFATELVAGKDISTQQDDIWGTSTTKSSNNDGEAPPDDSSGTGEGNDAKRALRVASTPPPALSGPLPLHTVVNPYAIVRGETAAIVTLVALLYVRFAHPFHHKSRQCALRERAALLQLWSGGQATSAEISGTPTDRSQSATGGSAKLPDSAAKNERAPSTRYSIENDMLHQLPAEEKTAWQLFREHCLPLFGTQAHPFLLRGGFWPSDAFESPELASMLSSLAIALRRSLELHRWHITLSCLVPVRTYSGLSCGVFTGPCASAKALLQGLRRQANENLLVERPPILQCVRQRQQEYLDAVARERVASSLHSLEEVTPQPKPPQEVVPEPTAETDLVEETITGIWQKDLLSLFVQRATLSVQLALPVLDLGSWRLLCGDLGLIGMTGSDGEGIGMYSVERPKRKESDCFQTTPESLSSRQLKPQLHKMDMEVITNIFQRAVMAVSLARDEVDPAVLQPARAAEDSPSPATSGSTWKNGGGVKKQHRAQQHVVPDIQMDMTYASFVMAMVLLAHHLYSSMNPMTQANGASLLVSGQEGPIVNSEWNAIVGGDDSYLLPRNSVSLDSGEANRSYFAFSSKLAYCSLGEAFQLMMQDIVLPSTAAHLKPTDPRFIIHHLTRGVKTQTVLLNLSPALLLVFQAYSRDVFGEPGMMRDDVLRLLRDAMLTSTELSQHLISDLFSSCSVLRQASEEAAIAKRKEMDRQVQDASSLSKSSSQQRRPGYRAVRIVDSAANADSAAKRGSQRKRVHVLTYECFCDLLCVLCNFKLPNVFVPFETRLLTFVNRSLLRPLLHTVPNLAPLVSRSQLSGVSNSNTLASDTTKGAGSSMVDSSARDLNRR